MRVIIWFQSPNVKMLIATVNILNKLYGDVCILGMTGTNKAASPSSGPISFIDKHDVAALDYDLIIVSGENSSMVDVQREAPELGIDPDKIVLDRTICLRNFSLERYQQLRQSQLSILSRNCWGGLVYHQMGLPFLSPTVNMFFNEQDFVKFACNPQYYCAQELRLVGEDFNAQLQFRYPIFMIDDVKLYMNHYRSADDAREKWRLRAARINWSNVLVVMYTDDRDVLAEFDKTPFDKKICFVPFETDIESAFYISPERFRGRELWQAVLATSQDDLICIDLWDLLISGKKTPISRR